VAGRPAPNPHGLFRGAPQALRSSPMGRTVDRYRLRPPCASAVPSIYQDVAEARTSGRGPLTGFHGSTGASKVASLDHRGPWGARDRRLHLGQNFTGTAAIPFTLTRQVRWPRNGGRERFTFAGRQPFRQKGGRRYLRRQRARPERRHDFRPASISGVKGKRTMATKHAVDSPGPLYVVGEDRSFQWQIGVTDPGAGAKRRI